VAVEPGWVGAEPLRRCVAIAVTGSLLVMAGVMLGFAAQAVGLPGGWPAAGAVAVGLIVAGMSCGVVLIAVSRPPAGTGPGRRRRTPHAGQRRPAPGRPYRA
jgi:hypothetical protein